MRSVGRSPVNILVVDDRRENVLALESLLKDSETVIHKASNGSDALDLLHQNDFAVAFLAVQMSGVNAYKLAELMRLQERTRTIPIIFVTSGAIDAKSLFKGYEAGAVDFLYMPLDPWVVRSKVRVFRELAQQKQVIQIQMQEMREALRVRDEFISIASHELKTPITSMQLQLQLIRRQLIMNRLHEFSPEKLGRSIDSSVKQLKKLVQIIDELLDVTRIRAGRLFVNMEEVDLTQLMISTVANFEDQLKNAGCELRLKLEEQVFCKLDSFRTEQVFANLLTNAAKYAPGTPVEITLTRVPGGVQATIQDYGPGIPKEKLDSIFEQFERIDNESAISGLGLGLYIAKQIMEAQGGSIHAESVPARGSRFTAYFPHSH